MGWEQLQPEQPVWQTESKECPNCARLAAEVQALVEAAKKSIPAMEAMNERAEGLSLIQKFERLHKLLMCVDELKTALERIGENKCLK